MIFIFVVPARYWLPSLGFWWFFKETTWHWQNMKLPSAPLGMVVYLLYSNPAPAWTSSTSLLQCLYAQLVEISHCHFLLQLFSYRDPFPSWSEDCNGAFAMKIIAYEQWTVICAHIVEQCCFFLKKWTVLWWTDGTSICGAVLASTSAWAVDEALSSDATLMPAYAAHRGGSRRGG